MLDKTRSHLKKLKTIKRKHISSIAKSTIWFITGAMLGLFFFASFIYIFYKQSHTTTVYSGVMVNGIDFGGRTKAEVKDYFDRKNDRIQKTTFILSGPNTIATISAKQLHLGYDSTLLADQAFSVGRSEDAISNISILAQAYLDGVKLDPTYHFDEKAFHNITDPMVKKYYAPPSDAIFKMNKGKVIAFQLSKEGQKLDQEKLKQEMYDSMLSVALADKPQTVTLKLPIVKAKPNLSTEESNNYGIKELVAEGTSTFFHSIENRAFNIGLAASRLNGVLIAPGENFSFVKAIGDVSSLTGYKQAYVIENGKTVLGDGGGVCQVSTTLFRAALNAGLPITERHPHAYRVGYYEQDSGPGIDAAVYYPTVDLKFKNDTEHYLMIQTIADMTNYRLTFRLYGTKDNRQVTLSKPVIVSETPAPPAIYQDDPTLPNGTVKQVDFPAAGASVFFTRTVKKNGEVVQSDKFISNYRPWQAIYLRGTM